MYNMSGISKPILEADTVAFISSIMINNDHDIFIYLYLITYIKKRVVLMVEKSVPETRGREEDETSAKYWTCRSE